MFKTLQTELPPSRSLISPWLACSGTTTAGLTEAITTRGPPGLIARRDLPTTTVNVVLAQTEKKKWTR